jgi:hypothetical protein
MARTSYEEALDNSIGLMEKGLTIEECLLTYPEYAAQLLGPLQSAETLHNGRSRLSIPAPTMRRDAFLSAVAEHAQGNGSSAVAAVVPPAAPARDASALWAPFRRLAMVPHAVPAVLAMLILGGAAWGVSAATGTAGPGSWLAGNSTHEDRVDLRGTVAAISTASITVTTPDGDVTAAITADTEFEGADDASALIGDFAVGDAVKLSATKTADGSLIVRKLEHEEVDDVEDPPVPTIVVPPTVPFDDINEPNGGNNDDDPGDDDDDDGGIGGDDDDGGISGDDDGADDDGGGISGDDGADDDGGGIGGDDGADDDDDDGIGGDDDGGDDDDDDD